MIFSKELAPDLSGAKNEEDEIENKDEIEREMEKFLQREKREVASFAVRINKGKLDKEIEMMKDEGGKKLLGLFRNLPENINFQQGKTLIIGDNATGKSTLAKALFLVCKKARAADLYRENSATLSDKEGFRTADESARKVTFEPNGYWEEWIRSSGLALNLGRSIGMDDFFTSACSVEYADFHEIIGKIKSRYDGMGISSEVFSNMLSADPARIDHSDYSEEVRAQRKTHLERVSDTSKKMGSARQTVEKKASELIHGDYNEPGPGVFFLDEPESGISPMRHRKIEENIDDMIGTNDLHPGSITIIPTNSIKLYESDLPRIDLRYPGRGIFRPSEFPDYFED